MDFGWLESLIFGLVSGLTQFMPVSAQAHEVLMLKLFGTAEDALLSLFVHCGVLLALFVNLRQHIGRLLRERELSKIPPRRRKRQPDMIRVLELRLLRTAIFVMIPLSLILTLFFDWKADLSLVALLLIVNGLILYIPGHIPNGNKDERSMSSLDGVLLGLSCAASIVPGISRVGITTSAGIVRGADKENALRWALLLSVPAILLASGMDIYGLTVSGPAWSFPTILKCLLAAAASFGGASLGISTMQFLAVRTGFSGFAYYCWGAALFSFVMYLTI